MTNKPIAIIGAGNGGQTTAAWLSNQGYQTRIFDVMEDTVAKLNELGGVNIYGNTDFRHALNGSAFGDGIDWIMRRSCSVLATSVLYRFPSEDNIFSCTIFSYNSFAPSVFSLRFRSLQYRRGFAVPVKTEITSIIEKYHSSFSASHAVRIF